MPATLRDVAQLAGVSFRTVSNVVNDYPYISEETRRRVEAGTFFGHIAYVSLSARRER